MPGHRGEPPLTAADAARRLGVSVSAIHHAIRRRALRATKHGLHRRGAWEIDPRDFLDYAERVSQWRKRGRGGGAARAIDTTGLLDVSDRAEGNPWSSWDTSLPSDLAGVDVDAAVSAEVR